MKIHHNTLKKAKSHGITLEVVENEVTASKDGRALASHPSGSVALEQAIAKLKEGGTVTGRITPSGGHIQEVDKAGVVSPVVADDDDDEEIEEAHRGEDDADEDADEGRSIVKTKYRKIYKIHGGNCGDDLHRQIRDHVTVTNKDGDEVVDPAKLRKFAELNGCWVVGYHLLSIGLQRMNIGNRLRAKIRKGHQVKWG